MVGDSNGMYTQQSLKNLGSRIDYNMNKNSSKPIQTKEDNAFVNTEIIIDINSRDLRILADLITLKALNTLMLLNV